MASPTATHGVDEITGQYDVWSGEARKGSNWRMLRFLMKNVDTQELSLSDTANTLVNASDHSWFLSYLKLKEPEWSQPKAKHLYIHDSNLSAWTACRGKLSPDQKQTRDQLARRLKDEYNKQRKLEPAKKNQVGRVRAVRGWQKKSKEWGYLDSV